MAQRIGEQISPFSAAKPEAHFFEVGLEMLRTEFMPTTAQPALEQRERRFNRVGLSASAHIISDVVLDGFMLEAQTLCDATIGDEFIGKEYVHVLPDIVAEKLLKHPASNFLSVKQAQLAITLPDSNDRTLFGAAPSLCETVALSADIGFIHLDLPAEFRLVGFNHCSANPMAQVPSGFVAHPDRPLNLAGRHAFLRSAEQERRSKPLFERQVSVIENRAREDGELIAA